MSKTVHLEASPSRECFHSKKEILPRTQRHGEIKESLWKGQLPPDKVLTERGIKIKRKLIIFVVITIGVGVFLAALLGNSAKSTHQDVVTNVANMP